jgi:hypothetical protein
MIIFISNIKGITALNLECNSPVPTDLYCPVSFTISLERVETQSRQIHIFKSVTPNNNRVRKTLSLYIALACQEKTTPLKVGQSQRVTLLLLFTFTQAGDSGNCPNRFRVQFQTESMDYFQDCVKTQSSFPRECFIKTFAGQPASRATCDMPLALADLHSHF